jgi:hypothetical protein
MCASQVRVGCTGENFQQIPAEVFCRLVKIFNHISRISNIPECSEFCVKMLDTNLIHFCFMQFADMAWTSFKPNFAIRRGHINDLWRQEPAEQQELFGKTMRHNTFQCWYTFRILLLKLISHRKEIWPTPSELKKVC